MMLTAWVLVQAAGADVPSATPITLQAQFEQATGALNAGKWQEAVTDFKAIEARPGISARTRGVVLLRQGGPLARLGRGEDAKRAYRQGLALVPKSDATLRDDRSAALIALGGLEQKEFDYVAARRDFEEARALATSAMPQLQVLVPLAAVTVFDDSAAALGYIDEAIRIAATAKIAPEADATIHDMRGRVLLNRGDLKGAQAEMLIALKDLGGLTEKTSLQDVTVRADLALVSLLLKDTNKAREYLAMTGEGRLPDGPFASAARMDLPPCGGDLQPSDDAVIEFGIGEDGNVSYANPVYASRAGSSAREFARAVSEWTWRPHDLAKVPAFYRVVTRIELRCSNAAERPADLALLYPDFQQWLARAGVNEDALPPKNTAPAMLRAWIAEEEAPGRNPARLVALLDALANAPATDFDERHSLYERASQLAQAQKAPGAVIAYLYLSSVDLRWRMTQNSKGRYAAAVRQMLARPDIAADGRTSAILRLVLGSPEQGQGYAPDAEPALKAVIDDKRLNEHDPLKVGALVRLASFQTQAGQVDAARQSYLKTGLDAQQCSLVDAQPAVKKTGVGSSDYPTDMLQLRVSGWTRIEFDILPSGETANRRAVISYPPFAFGEETVKAMAKTRFTQTYRPQGALGCGGASLNFRYLVPQS